MNRLLFSITSLILLVLLTSHGVVMACSSAGEFRIEELPSMDYLVKATVIDTDDRGHNAILRIEDYYKGEGKQLVVVNRYPVSLESTNAVRGYHTSCLYSGQGDRWIKGSQGYFGLTPNGDGTFTDMSNDRTAHYYAWDGQITQGDGATEGYAIEFGAYVFMSEDEFIEKLLEAGHRTETIPPTIEGIQHYPLMRYLDVVTENGTRYQINPDRSLSQLPDTAPLAISTDGAHVAFKLDDNIIGFQYYWTEYLDSKEATEYGYDQIKLSGQQVKFSKDSHMVAIWEDYELRIYLFDGRDQDPPRNQMTMTEIAYAELDSLLKVIWSADSSTIAWEDSTGIWRWNLFEDAEATQIEEARDLLDLSTYGRYVRYGEIDDWTLFDSQTGDSFENAVAAPTEQFLVFIVGDDKPLPDWHETDCKPPLRENCASYVYPRFEYESVSVFPYQMELLGFEGCSGLEFCDIRGISWHPSTLNNGYRGGRYIHTFQSHIQQIEYDVFYDQVAVLRGDYQIEFEFYDSRYFTDDFYASRIPYLDYVSLEFDVDSPIASIEWGQPIFYDSFMFTATQYLP
jgi:hypothetical protein